MIINQNIINSLGKNKSGGQMNKSIDYQDLIKMEPLKLKGNYKNRKIWLNDEELNPGDSLKIYNHNPKGFDWGQSDDGSAQLALAVLMELTQNKRISMILHHIFKNEIISTLPRADFEIEIDFGEWLNKHTNKNYMFPKQKDNK
jgi:hypothetical protein